MSDDKKTLLRSPSGLRGPGVLSKPPEMTRTASSGGFRPKKAAELEAAINAPLVKQSSTLSPAKPAALTKTPTSGGFKPRPELLAQAQQAAALSGTAASLDARLNDDEEERPTWFLKKTPSGLSGPGMIKSSSSGAFRPRVSSASLPVPAPAPAPASPPPKRPSGMLQKRTSAAQMVVEAVASEESDPVATYMRDAMWYSRSYGLGSDEKVEKKAIVNRLLRGPSTSLMKEILDDDETATAGPPPPARESRQSSTPRLSNGGGNGASSNIDAHLAKTIAALEKQAGAKDAAIASLTKALQQSEKRSAMVLERMDMMQAQMAELAAAVRTATGASFPKGGALQALEESKKKAEEGEEGGPLSGVMRFFGRMTPERR